MEVLVFDDRPNQLIAAAEASKRWSTHTFTFTADISEAMLLIERNDLLISDLMAPTSDPCIAQEGERYIQESKNQLNWGVQYAIQAGYREWSAYEGGKETIQFLELSQELPIGILLVRQAARLGKRYLINTALHRHSIDIPSDDIRHEIKDQAACWAFFVFLPLYTEGLLDPSLMIEEDEPRLLLNWYKHVPDGWRQVFQRL